MDITTQTIVKPQNRSRGKFQIISNCLNSATIGKCTLICSLFEKKTVREKLSQLQNMKETWPRLHAKELQAIGTTS